MATKLLDPEEEIAITDARPRIAELCNQVMYSAKHIILTRHGKRTAALIPMEEYEALQEAYIARVEAEIAEKGTITLNELHKKLSK